jgi:hypothetical protein
MSGASIILGSRIYLRNAIAGEPGICVGFNRKGWAEIYWPDLHSEMGRHTFHALDTLILDESFSVRQLDLFDEIAA